MMGGYWTLPDPRAVIMRAAKSAKAERFRTPAKWSLQTSLLERLALNLQGMAAFGQFIEKEHTMVRQRHVARHPDVPPADQPHVGDGLVGGGLKLLFTPPHSPRYN
jgi:hypothetical protein